ncbi:hypothetical protein LCGC14_0890400 [marine sediment metagenome]|uniref:Uncharacterized protein n=1 Tax=marine sediment metagenome TaxID=412755 RepID=A0A0F9NZH8_9ZZZZ
MGDGDDYTGKSLPGTAEDSGRFGLPAITKTVQNAWQINVNKWFGLRAPTQDEAKQLRLLRSKYLGLAYLIVDTCPANPDRTRAIRQLKQSMQTANSSIVCSDTWEDLPGPKGD